MHLVECLVCLVGFVALGGFGFVGYRKVMAELDLLGGGQISKWEIEELLDDKLPRKRGR